MSEEKDPNEDLISIPEWAEANGIPRQTAYRWAYGGHIPVEIVQVPTYRVHKDTKPPELPKGKPPAK